MCMIIFLKKSCGQLRNIIIFDHNLTKLWNKKDRKILFLDFQLFNYIIISLIIWKFSRLISTFECAKINDSESYDRRINMKRILWPKVCHLFYCRSMQLIFQKNFFSPPWLHGTMNFFFISKSAKLLWPILSLNS